MPKKPLENDIFLNYESTQATFILCLHQDIYPNILAAVVLVSWPTRPFVDV